MGNDTNKQDDSQAVRNMDECERIGMPYGVYLYSYALTEEDAESEAAHVLRMIKNRNPKMGIWLDMEDADEYKAQNGVSLNKENGELYTKICATFTAAIRDAGYKNVGIYASKSVLDTIIGKEYLEHGDIKVWVAQWSKECTYQGKYDMWQYSSDGVVNGSSARTDMDYYYGSFDDAVKPGDDTVKDSTSQSASTKYKVGQKVRVSSYYASSTEVDSNKAVIRNATGTITKVIAGARNPYLLDNGAIGWCNDGIFGNLLQRPCRRPQQRLLQNIK